MERGSGEKKWKNESLSGRLKKEVGKEVEDKWISGKRNKF